MTFKIYIFPQSSTGYISTLFIESGLDCKKNACRWNLVLIVPSQLPRGNKDGIWVPFIWLRYHFNCSKYVIYAGCQNQSLHYQCALLSAVFLRASQCMFKTKPFLFKCKLAKKGAAYEITISYFQNLSSNQEHITPGTLSRKNIPYLRPNKKPSYKLDRLDTWFLKGCVKHHKGLLDIPKSTNQPLCFLAHDWHIRLVTNRVT